MTRTNSRKTYDAETRRRAVKVLASGSCHRALAGALGLPEATARQWARAYAVGGAAAVMNAGKTHRIYPYELKLSVVKDRFEGGKSVRDVMIKYGVPSESSVKTWCRQYKERGPEALIDRPRGRKPKKRTEKKADEHADGRSAE